MKKNAGNLDRGARVVLGIGLLSITVIGPQTPWGYIGLVPLITGLIGYCPLYSILGFNSCPLKKR